jgi:BirA family biotin operon repressor/biotin-[acetyl-CoA-carboxylase] ligase
VNRNFPRGVNRDYEPLESEIATRGLTIGKPMELMEEIDSTNDAAKRAAKNDAPHGALFVAESQSRGRGRQGRAWLGARGESILASVVLRVRCAPRDLPPISLAVGLAARDAVANALGEKNRAKLKWPNDVVIDGKKVAGVLIEAVLTSSRVEAVIVGVGVNVHQRNFPDEIADRATSIALHAHEAPDRANVLVDFLSGLDRDVAHVASRGLGLVHARITAADALRGNQIRTDDGIAGVAIGIDLDGALRVRKEDGAIVRLSAGEVHLVRI